MTIHNYGNDYAYQQKQKSIEAEAKQVQEPKEEMKDAGDQATQGGGQDHICEESPKHEGTTEGLVCEKEAEPTKEETEAIPEIQKKKKK